MKDNYEEEIKKLSYDDALYRLTHLFLFRYLPKKEQNHIKYIAWLKINEAIEKAKKYDELAKEKN